MSKSSILAWELLDNMDTEEICRHKGYYDTWYKILSREMWNYSWHTPAGVLKLQLEEELFGEK